MGEGEGESWSKSLQVGGRGCSGVCKCMCAWGFTREGEVSLWVATGNHLVLLDHAPVWGPWSLSSSVTAIFQCLLPWAA